MSGPASPIGEQPGVGGGFDLGVDVGGTHTDAVLLREGQVCRAVKKPTSAEVTGGVTRALREVAAGREEAIRRVVIGTTHFTNAVLTGEGLARVAAVRVGLPASASLPPFCDWPAGLADRVRGPVFQVAGGAECDGREIAPLDEDGVAEAGRRIREAGVREIALSAVFAPIEESHETRAAAILAEVHPEARLTESRGLGRIGLLGRENAGLLNAALGPLAERVTTAFGESLRESGIEAPLYLARNDGAVAEVSTAARTPVLSLSSGPTNSMIGAAHLSGRRDAIVVDVGGTTTDLGCLQGGFPRQAPREVEIGGVRTLFRMPDLLSLAIGGGSLVAADGAAIGPGSVGFRLTEAAFVFGGSTRTATDLAVAAGRAAIGDPAAVRETPPETVRRFTEVLAERLGEAVDRMKPDAREMPLLAVGGAAFLVPARIPGISGVEPLPHGEVANAVGAAIARVSGETDRVFHGMDREEAFRQATEQAKRRAISAGADPEGLEVVEREDLPLAYLPGDARRVRVRVVGEAAAAAGGGRPAGARRPGVSGTGRIPFRRDCGAAIRACRCDPGESPPPVPAPRERR